MELEQEREETELCRQQEELRLQQLQQQREQELQQQQREQELRLKIQQQEDELRLWQRALENERKKAEEDENQKKQRRLKLELTKGSSRASGSVADDIESVGSKRNHGRTAGWAESVAQQSAPRRPLSPNVVIDPPTKVTQGRNDKRFSTYPKTTPLFQTQRNFSQRN